MSRQPKGFTLIEVLVVVAIIALLVAVLVPSLMAARKSAQTSVCASNLHQLALANETYFNQNGCYPPHKWKLPNGSTDYWPAAVALYLRAEKLQVCPSVPDWVIGRNNPYGYNYRYLGSLRLNSKSPTAPYENFPVKAVRVPSATIAYADSDGTGWKHPYAPGMATDPDAIGHHGYTLDPTFIPTYAVDSMNAEGLPDTYAYRRYRSYISDRHKGSSNAVWCDGHVDRIRPQQVYSSNHYWNGLGGEDPVRDPHVSYRFLDGEWRFPGV